MGLLLKQWEAEQAAARRRTARQRAAIVVRGLLLAAVGFGVGIHFATAPLVRAEASSQRALQARISQAEAQATAKQGELELFRLEMRRLRQIFEQSARYRIPADLATAIYDAAIAEGVDPVLGFRLVRTESGFSARAVSHKGAVGLTQVMPSTAYEMDPSLRYQDLFRRETNLRLGFRYLRRMIERYDGDVRLALLAYNRGPATVDSIREAGGDPSNGYARQILGDPPARSARRTQPR